MVRIQTEDFDIGTLYQTLQNDVQNTGAIVSFSGLVRELSSDNTIKALSLEHYPGMTESILEKIEKDATQRWQLTGSIIIHRVGTLHAGDNIVLVMTAAAHRKQAFEAAQYIMDILKTEAPFWKKEHTDNGDYWVASKASDLNEKKKWQR